MWVKIWTALPSTTPRPAPKSSADDLACDLWERTVLKDGLTLVGSRRAEADPVVNRLDARPTLSRPRLKLRTAPARHPPQGTRSRNLPPYGGFSNEPRRVSLWPPRLLFQQIATLRIIAFLQHRFYLQRPSGIISRT